MREILFRGKTSNGDWVEGDLIRYGEYISIRKHLSDTQGIPSYREIIVAPKTGGQFTGFSTEKFKKTVDPRVWEDDVFRSTTDDDGDRYNVVMWIDQRAAFYIVPIEHYYVLRDNDCSKEPEFDWLFNDASLYNFSIDCKLTKVGNIHDNPELLNK